MADQIRKARDHGTFPKNHPSVVSHEEWSKAHRAMLVKEKTQMKARDALVAERRRMPWMEVDAGYKFEGPKGRVTLLTAVKEPDHSHLPVLLDYLRR